MPGGLTGEGAQQFAEYVFRYAEIALYDLERQDLTTDWQPYSIEENTPVVAPRQLARAELRLLSANGEAWFHAAVSPLAAGDSATLPAPSTWFGDSLRDANR